MDEWMRGNKKKEKKANFSKTIFSVLSSSGSNSYSDEFPSLNEFECGV